MATGNIEERIKEFKEYQSQIQNIDLFGNTISTQGTSTKAYYNKNNYSKIATYDTDTCLGVNNDGYTIKSVGNWDSGLSTKVNLSNCTFDGETLEDRMDNWFNKKLDDKYKFVENDAYKTYILDEDMLI